MHLVGIGPDRQPKGSCQTKVCKLQLLDGSIEEDVLRLEIPVEDPAVEKTAPF